MLIDKTLTLAQFFAIAFFLNNERIFFGSMSFLLLLAVVPAIWAFILQNRFFSIFPMPVSGAKLIQEGPYRYIRHPMYSSVFLFCLVVLAFGLDKFLLFKFFITILIVSYKIVREENYLENEFPEYTLYKKKTKFIIPFLF